MDALVMASLIFYGLIISFGSYWNAFSRENCFYPHGPHCKVRTGRGRAILVSETVKSGLNESIESVFTAFYEFVTHWQRYHKEKHTSIRDHVWSIQQRLNHFCSKAHMLFYSWCFDIINHIFNITLENKTHHDSPMREISFTTTAFVSIHLWCMNSNKNIYSLRLPSRRISLEVGSIYQIL